MTIAAKKIALDAKAKTGTNPSRSSGSGGAGRAGKVNGFDAKAGDDQGRARVNS